MGGHRILVVDDDRSWLSSIQLILAGQYELELTTQPSEATAFVRSSFFSLAILDQRLSADITGVKLLLHLRTIQHDLRGIILTGYAELDDAVESMKSGAIDYISKGRRDLASELRSRVERALSRNLDEEELVAMIERGESAELEFKSSARWDMRLRKVNHDLVGMIIKMIAAFLNSEGGGVLLIGVDDSGKVVGLEDDYRTLKKRDRDGFENFLVTLLLRAYGYDVSPLIRIEFHHVDGKDVCRISAKPAPKAVFVPDGAGAEHLYIRAGNSTRLLSTREAIEYCKMRWR